MNLDKYEKIDGREALKRLAEGEEVFTGKGSQMRLDFENHQMVNGYGGVVSFYPLHAILTGTWYIPKPFDVRQAMRDRPNEWVGAFKFSGSWYKVGFDSNYMTAVETGFKNDVRVVYHNEFNDHVDAMLLNTCIPIEDVPEEATR